MNTVSVTYHFRTAETTTESASSASAGWAFTPISRKSERGWTEVSAKRPKLTAKSFFNGMASLMEFPGLFPRRR